MLRKRIPALPEQRNVSGSIVLLMTAFLILAGTGLYYCFENETSLNGMDNVQKLIVSFFGSVSARTAGFNITDISLWGYPTVFLMIILMWIGASPGSTGGGIKTTTFAIALRSAWNNIRGRQQLVIGNREISHNTVTRVLSIILLSLLFITIGFFCLLVFEPAKNPVHLLFESVSAFCTVGLSLADTSTFSQAGKMKYIVIGLGYFGSKLASNLTSMGHEVIGIDNHSERLDELKDSITTVMKMDSTSINAIKSLPLNDTDAVIVAIGEDVGSSVLTLSILKSLNVKRIIGRAIHRTHQDILNMIGIEEVILPLEESAMHVSSMLQIKNTLRITEINDEYAVAEIHVPAKYIGHSLDTLNIKNRFNLVLVAVKIPPKEGVITSIFRRNYKVDLSYDVNLPLGEKDILVLAGKFNDIKRFSES